MTVFQTLPLRQSETGQRFQPAFYRWCQHAASAPIRIATKDEVDATLAIARDSMTLAAETVVARIHDAYPAQFLVSGEVDGSLRLLAYLGLNSAGVAALLEGRFSGLAPDPKWLVPAAQAEALYIWLVWAPRNLGQGTRLIDHMEKADATGIPIFSRAVTEVSARAQHAIGFDFATTLYPAAPEWLLVILPVSTERKPTIEIRPARTMEDLCKIFSVRSAVYIAEQFPLYAEEFDGNDFCATQMMSTVDGDPAGCMRIRWFGEFAKIERVAVRKEYRRYHLGVRMVRAATEHCRRKGYRRLYAHSRADLVPLWSTLGWRDMGSADFSFADIPYREITLDIEPDDDMIRIGADPMLLLRPEGAWDELGPFDRSQLGGDFGRQDLIRRHAGLRPTAARKQAPRPANA